MDVPGFALITGAASGIGRACAKAFAKEGAAGLALVDINRGALESVKAEIERCGKPLHRPTGTKCRVHTRPMDVRVEKDVETTLRDVAEEFGRLDYVVNAAGIAFKHRGGAAFAKTGDWQRVVDTNLTGSFIVLREASRIMLKQDPILSAIDRRPLQRGSIVNFASIMGVVGVSQSTAYTATKHAVIGLTRTASEDYAKDGLRINAICPGYTKTPLTTEEPDMLRAMEDKVATAVPMQRMGRPEEIADGVLYLAGGRSSFMTGSTLVIDGCYTSK